MKLSIQHTLLPGETLGQKLQLAAKFGFDGVELAAWGFENPMWDYVAEVENAVDISGVHISSLCTQRVDDFVHPDLEERTKRIAGLAKYLQLADELRAEGVIGLPLRKAVQIPDLSPIGDAFSLITQLAVAALQSALSQSKDAQAAVLLEPLNRYETHYLRTVGHAADLCTKVGDSRVRIMADLFHMNIEETDIAGATESVVNHIGHIHLADSNRLEPGQGHTNFVEVFSVLKLANYSGWFALECGLSDEAEKALPNAVRLIREQWEQA